MKGIVATVVGVHRAAVVVVVRETRRDDAVRRVVARRPLRKRLGENDAAVFCPTAAAEAFLPPFERVRAPARHARARFSLATRS